MRALLLLTLLPLACACGGAAALCPTGMRIESIEAEVATEPALDTWTNAGLRFCGFPITVSVAVSDTEASVCIRTRYGRVCDAVPR